MYFAKALKFYVFVSTHAKRHANSFTPFLKRFLWSDQWKKKTLKDLIGLRIFARTHDPSLPEWCECKLIDVVAAGIKVRVNNCENEEYLVASQDVANDLRLPHAFVAWETSKRRYDGNLCLIRLCL